MRHLRHAHETLRSSAYLLPGVLSSCWLQFAVGAPVGYSFEGPDFPAAYVDQPGVVSQADIAYADSRMTAIAGYKLPSLKRVASGRLVRTGQESGARVELYALYDTPYEKVSDRVQTAVRMICTKRLSPPDPSWICQQPYLAVRITSDGVPRDIRFSTQLVTATGTAGDKGYLPDDPRTAADVVDFIYSPCLGAKYAEFPKRKGPPPPASPSILGMSRSRWSGTSVFIGEPRAPDIYDLERTVGAKDGCAFKIVRMEIEQDRVVIAEQQERDAPKAKAEAQKIEQKREAQEHVRLSKQREEDKFVSLSLICGFAALVVPWFLKGRWVAAIATGALTGAFVYLLRFSGDRSWGGDAGVITLLLVILTPALTVCLLIWACVDAIRRVGGK